MSQSWCSCVKMLFCSQTWQTSRAVGVEAEGSELRNQGLRVIKGAHILNSSWVQGCSVSDVIPLGTGPRCDLSFPPCPWSLCLTSIPIAFAPLHVNSPAPRSFQIFYRPVGLQLINLLSAVKYTKDEKTYGFVQRTGPLGYKTELNKRESSWTLGGK